MADTSVKDNALNTKKTAQAVEVKEPVVEPVELVVEPEPAPPPVSIKVKYVGGQGIDLAYPISTGQRSFVSGVVYELKNYGDFCRLTDASPHFVEVKDDKPAR